MRHVDEKIITYLQRQAVKCQGKTVIVAVSGGPDSMALLHFFASYKQPWNLNVIAVTVNHQLRGQDADDDVAHVAHICALWKIPLEAVVVDVQAHKKATNKSTQVAARELRYEAFAQMMEKHKAHFLALGHHGDDQIETMLMAFIRTADGSSFHGIPFCRTFATGSIIRPFLEVTKEEIWTYCHENKIVPRIDQSNDDVSYRRNDIRKHLAPRLKQYNPSIHETLNQLQETLQVDEAFLQAEAKKAWDQCIGLDGDYIHIQIKKYRMFDKAIQRRIYRMLMDYVYDEQVDLSYHHERIWNEMMHEMTGNQVLQFPHGIYLERAYDLVRLGKHQRETPQDSVYILKEFEESVSMDDGASLTLTIQVDDVEDDKWTYLLNRTDIHLPLTIRTRRAGDRMSYRGLVGTKKIKDILMDEKIPAYERDKITIVEDAKGQIIWLVGMKKRYTPKKEEALVCLQWEKKIRGK